jgi:hypothetical protein
MSSRSYAQKSAQSKFFVVVDRTGNTQYTTPAYLEAELKDVTVPYTVVGDIISTETYDDMYTLYDSVYYDEGFGSSDVGTLLRDLGKKIEFRIDGALFARWNLVQVVNGPMTEGVSGLEADTFYVTTVQNDNPSPNYWEVIGVARVG